MLEDVLVYVIWGFLVLTLAFAIDILVKIAIDTHVAISSKKNKSTVTLTCPYCLSANDTPREDVGEWKEFKCQFCGDDLFT